MSRILAQHPDYVALARKVLYWVFYAVRPLTVKEIQHALAVQPEDSSIDEDNIVDEELLVSVCTGIITIQKESGVIGLVHYTAQQYFERTAERYFPEARHDIVRTCLTYLSFEEFDEGPCQDHRYLQARLDTWSLLRYAAQHWAEHASLKNLAPQFSSKTRLSVKLSRNQADAPLTGQDEGPSATQVTKPSRSDLISSPNHNWEASSHTGDFEQSSHELVGSPSDVSNAEASNLKLITSFLNQGAKVASFLEIAALRSDFRAPDPLIYLRTFPSTLSALSVCALFNLKITAEHILYTGGDVSTRDGYRRTPLHYAALYGHEAISLLLLEHHADVAAKDVWNSTPLHQAAIRGHEAVLRMLLNKGANVAAQDVDGYTPLHHAVIRGSYSTIRALLDRGADVNAKSRAKETPLHITIGNSPEAVTRLLLDMGADVNAKDGTGRTPLHLTAIDGSHLAPLLLEYGANPSMKDNSGIPVLHWAVRYGRMSLTMLFLKSSAEIESTDNIGRTPLHWAAQSGHKELTESLLKGGASIVARDDQGMTALHYAATFEKERIMQLLLEHGADITSRDRAGRSAMDMTTFMCNKPATQLLLQHGADIVDPNSVWGSILQAAAQRGDVEMTRLILDFGADVNASGGFMSQGRTALHLASGTGSLGCVEVLLNHGANSQILDGQERTCLHHAASSDSARTISHLLEKGLDPRAVDINGWTALDWAARAGKHINFKILSEAVAGEIDLRKPRNLAIYHGRGSLLAYLETLSQKPEAEGGKCLPIEDLSGRPSHECSQSQGPPNSESETDQYWTELATLDSQLPSTPAPRHLGVWCDGCDLPICGPRYKCNTCADFDYCFKCITSSKSNHPSHHFRLVALEGATAFNVQLSLRVQLNWKEKWALPLDRLKPGKRHKVRSLPPHNDVD